MRHTNTSKVFVVGSSEISYLHSPSHLVHICLLNLPSDWLGSSWKIASWFQLYRGLGRGPLLPQTLHPSPGLPGPARHPELTYLPGGQLLLGAPWSLYSRGALEFASTRGLAQSAGWD